MSIQLRKLSMMELFLGFKVDYRNTLITDKSENDIPDTVYEDEEHMMEVLDAIINKSRQQLGFQKSG